MILFYVNHRGNKHQANVIRELYRSFKGPKMLQSTSRFVFNEKLNNTATTIVFAGILRGEGNIYKWCLEKGKNFLFVDHAYLERGYNTDYSKQWMRITPNAFTWSRNEVETPDRWQKYFANKYKLMPWNSHNGSKILVLPPSRATIELFPESVAWMEATINKISQVTNAEIRIREKPDQPLVDTNNEVTGRITFAHEKSIETEMMESKCIVTFNSAVPVMGTILGIPCYCSPNAAAYPMSIDLTQIDNPPEPQRQRWLDQLVFHQYTGDEIKNETAWNIMSKYLVTSNSH